MINVNYNDTVTGQYDDNGNLVGAYFNDTGESIKDLSANYLPGQPGHYRILNAAEFVAKHIDPNNIEGSVRDWDHSEDMKHLKKSLVWILVLAYVVLYLIGMFNWNWSFSWILLVIIPTVVFSIWGY